MPGNKRPRKPRPAPSGPPKVIKDFAKSYECSHCHSRVTEIVKHPSGIYQVMVGHDESCPVLRGVLSDMPDTVRAAVATGRASRVMGDPNGGGAE